MILRPTLSNGLKCFFFVCVNSTSRIHLKLYAKVTRTQKTINPYLRNLLIIFGLHQLNQLIRESLSIESKVCGWGNTTPSNSNSDLGKFV